MMTRKLLTMNAFKSQPVQLFNWFWSGPLKSLLFMPDNGLQIVITSQKQRINDMIQKNAMLRGLENFQENICSEILSVEARMPQGPSILNAGPADIFRSVFHLLTRFFCSSF